MFADLDELKSFKLCYVDGSAAYFTTQDLTKQWGDDWDDAPYEHNAGRPYEAIKERGEDWRIYKCFFEGGFETPGSWETNSRYSVQDINNKAIAWLSPCYFAEHKVFIHAGTTLDEFIRLVQSVGGTVYLPVTMELER